MEDLVGKVFRDLTVIKHSKSRSKYKIPYWQCSCICGKATYVSSGNLKSGNVKSCGCLRRRTKSGLIHGLTSKGVDRGIWNSWESMMSRCYYKRHKSYKAYGGAGIKVCKRWHRVESFYADMGSRPKGTTLDRINGTKGYYKSNCRWASPSQQQGNKKSCIMITYKGETRCAADWARKVGLDRHVVVNRFKKGWPIEMVLDSADYRGRRV